MLIKYPFIPLKANHNYINFFLNFVISDKQCTVLPELADESTVSAIDSPGAQGTHSSTYIYIYIYKAIRLQEKVMF